MMDMNYMNDKTFIIEMTSMVEGSHFVKKIIIYLFNFVTCHSYISEAHFNPMWNLHSNINKDEIEHPLQHK